MTIDVSRSHARANLARLFDRAVNDPETITVTHRNGARVALIAADEPESYEETAYLLRSPENTRRLLRALRESLGDELIPFEFRDLRGSIVRVPSQSW